MQLDWLNKFIECMWPHLNKVCMHTFYWCLKLLLLHLWDCVFVSATILDSNFQRVTNNSILIGNLQDCKEYSKAHYCWTNSKVQNWFSWIWRTWLGFSTTNFSRLSSLSLLCYYVSWLQIFFSTFDPWWLFQHICEV